MKFMVLWIRNHVHEVISKLNHDGFESNRVSIPGGTKTLYRAGARLGKQNKHRTHTTVAFNSASPTPATQKLDLSETLHLSQSSSSHRGRRAPTRIIAQPKPAAAGHERIIDPTVQP
jgi:hypothetical protein